MSSSEVVDNNNDASLGKEQDVSVSITTQTTPTNVQFDRHITIKDIAAAHDTGLSFDKYIATISSNAKSPTATEGQLAAWDFIKNSVNSYPDLCKGATSSSPSNSIDAILNQGKEGACKRMMSFAFEVCQGDPAISGCTANKAAIDNYLKSKNLLDVKQTDNLAYEHLEIMAAKLNPSNTTDDMIYFSGNRDAAASAFQKGVLSVM